MTTLPNKITAANAGGPRPLVIRSRWAARVAQFVRRKHMEVSVTIDLSVVPQPRHVEQMLSAARSLTDDPSSVRVTCPPSAPKEICAVFSIPKARQVDGVDRIGRRFWQVEDYQNSSIGFSPSPKRTRRTSGSSQ